MPERIWVRYVRIMAASNHRKPRTIALASAAALALVLSFAPSAAHADTTYYPGSRTCGSAGAPYVHLNSNASGTITHWHRRGGTGTGSYVATTYANNGFTFRVSSRNYTSETIPYFQLANNGSISSWGSSCDT